MTSLLRNVLVLLVAAWLAIPTVCDEGGENNGGTGVWILPCCVIVPETGFEQSTAIARGEKVVANTSGDITMQLASQMGVATATFFDDIAGQPIALAVTGRVVTISQLLLQAVEQSSRSGTIIVTDSTQTGYILRVLVAANGSVRVSVY